MNSNGKQNKKEETINVFGYISLFFSTRFHDSEEVVDDDDAVGNEEGEELSAYEQLRATNIKERERNGESWYSSSQPSQERVGKLWLIESYL